MPGVLGTGGNRRRKLQFLVPCEPLAVSPRNLAAALEGVADQIENPTLRTMLVELRKNVEIEHYEAGHMMYVHPGSMGKFSDTIKAFIDANGK